MTNSKYYLLALTLLALAIAPTFASAQSYITTLYNTGVDDNGVLLNNGSPNGAVDPHYTIISGPANFWGTGFSGGLAYTTAPLASWWKDPFVAEWVNPYPNGTKGPLNAQSGTYSYQTTFYLNENCDVGKTVYLTGQFAAADSACVYVNNATSPVACTTGGSTTPTFFKFNGLIGVKSATVPFVLGVNRLTFQVTHTNNNPTGLMVEIVGSVQ